MRGAGASYLSAATSRIPPVAATVVHSSARSRRHRHAARRDVISRAVSPAGIARRRSNTAFQQVTALAAEREHLTGEQILLQHGCTFAASESNPQRMSVVRLLVYSYHSWQLRMPVFRRQLKRRKLTQSMSRKSNCLSISAMESFFGTPKSECVRLTGSPAWINCVIRSTATSTIATTNASGSN